MDTTSNNTSERKLQSPRESAPLIGVGYLTNAFYIPLFYDKILSVLRPNDVRPKRQ